MFLLRLCVFVCVNLFLYGKCSIPEVKLCASSDCREPISVAKGMLMYTPKEIQGLSFRPGQKILIVSKGEKESDYWGAVINGKFGYVPSQHVKEVQILHPPKDLIVVRGYLNESESDANASNIQIPSENVKKKSSPPELSQSVEGVLSDSEKSSPTQKNIHPEKSFQIFEGTTIYENDEITPSATADANAAPQTASVPERMVISPEILEMNSSFEGQKMNGVESADVEDENVEIKSSKDFNEEDDEDEDEGEGEDDEEENEEEDEDFKESLKQETGEKHEEIMTSSAQSALSENVNNSPETVIESSVFTNVQTENSTDKNETPSNQVPSSWDLLNDTSKNNVPPPKASPLPHANLYIENTTAQMDDFKFSNDNAASERLGHAAGTATPSEQLQPQASAVSHIPSETLQPQSTGVFPNSAPQHIPDTLVMQEQHSEASSKTEIKNEILSSKTPPSLSNAAGTAAQQQLPLESPSLEIPSATPPSLLNAAGTAAQQQLPLESPSLEIPSATPPSLLNAAGTAAQQQLPFESPSLEIPSATQVSAGSFSGAPQSVLEIPKAAAQQQPKDSSFAEIISEIPSASAESDFVPPEHPSLIKNEIPSPTSPPEVISNKAPPSSGDPEPESAQSTPQATIQIPDTVTPQKVSEDPTEAFPSSSQSIISKTATIFNQFSVSADTLPQGEKPDSEGVTSEALKAQEKITESYLSEAVTEQPNLTPEQEFPSSAENSGLMSQITGIFSSWFTSPTKEETVVEKEFKDPLINEASSGTCQNPESDFDCKDTFWTAWLPTAFGLNSFLTQSNTLVYLVVTAVTVLLFTLGHNLIETRGVTGPLIAKINKLEHELLVTSKECLLLKDEIQSAREKITLYENSANDELIVTLQAELEESKKVKAELESSIEVLQQELDAATEAGLDLNKMLSEVLTQKGGSDSLLKSVENLQAQLDSQQEVINEMTKKLGIKNQENEDLQTALNLANERSQNLEEELTDMKHNLNLHLKEKEELTADLNTQINQLKTRIHQLAETKEKEISKLKKDSEELQKRLSETTSAFAVKEEEVKALKESMEVLKTPTDVKMDTVFDISRVKAELSKEVKENQLLLEKLKKEEAKIKTLMEQVKALNGKVDELKKSFEEAEGKKEEAEKKLEVLSTYFKEKETQLQKELGLQEALWAQKKGDEKAVYNIMKSLQEEVESYKSQNETLKQEILDQERALKSQMASYEQKAYENWVAARQAERKLEESKQEMAQLRNRLIMVEKNSNSVDGKGNLRSPEELNGVEATSPILHETSSPLLFPPLPLDPNSSTLLPPGFMPPPMFIPPPMGGFMPPPPFLPGDRRPPPLGRMSSPPLNNRFSPSSPADYPFERMSSPPLSPAGRLANEEREHYRHRTPPFPPPLHPRNWDDSNEMPGFIPISSQRDSRRDHKAGSNISSEHSSSESLDKSSRHSGRV